MSSRMTHDAYSLLFTNNAKILLDLRSGPNDNIVKEISIVLWCKPLFSRPLASQVHRTSNSILSWRQVIRCSEFRQLIKILADVLLAKTPLPEIIANHINNERHWNSKILFSLRSKLFSPESENLMLSENGRLCRDSRGTQQTYSVRLLVIFEPAFCLVTHEYMCVTHENRKFL